MSDKVDVLIQSIRRSFVQAGVDGAMTSSTLKMLVSTLKVSALTYNQALMTEWENDPAGLLALQLCQPMDMFEGKLMEHSEARSRHLKADWVEQMINDLPSLIQDAEEAQRALATMAASDSEWDELFIHGHRIHVASPANGLAAGGTVVNPGCKGKHRIEQKAMQRRRGPGDEVPYRSLVDIARLTFKFPTSAALLTCINAFKQADSEGLVKLQWVDNKFARPTPLGYSDVNLGVGVPVASGRTHIAEVQLTVDSFQTAKDLAHVAYEKIRSTIPDQKAQSIIAHELKRPGSVRNDYFNNIVSIFELATAAQVKDMRDIVFIGIDWPTWWNPLNMIRPVRLSQDELLTLKAFRICESSSSSPVEFADVLQQIRQTWGCEANFEQFVREKLPTVVLEAKRQWLRKVPNAISLAMQLIFGEAG